MNDGNPGRGPEARKWLTESKNSAALAANRFGSTKEVLKFVEKLYESGATYVEIEGISDEPSRIENEGDAYADSLDVYLPENPDQRLKLFEIFNEENESEGFDDDPFVDTGQADVTLWWD